MLSGILPVHKPKGISSFDVIREIKRKIPDEWRKEKIGHGGTLDIPAEGVLPILFGEATKAFDALLNSRKVYRAVVQLGSNTDSDDADGEVTESFDKKTAELDVLSVLPHFTGKIEQVPPKYSALKINGVRSSDLARNDREVVLKPRTVEIFELKIDNFDEPAQRFTMTVTCSSGTYIRSLARDIGKAVGSGGHILELLRTKSAGISLDQCVRLESINRENAAGLLLDVNSVLDLPALELEAGKEHILSGKPLSEGLFTNHASGDGVYKIVREGKLLALIERKGNVFKYLRVFHA